jgi:hypothetical protein
LRHGPRAQVLREEREREIIRGSILHTGHRIRQENYIRYNRLTLAPDSNNCSIATGG